jgi:hypothetical protein
MSQLIKKERAPQALSFFANNILSINLNILPVVMLSKEKPNYD